MQTTVLEIREADYLIKLPKNDFDLAFIHQLIKRIQTERFLTSMSATFEEDDLRSRALESQHDLRFDTLSEK